MTEIEISDIEQAKMVISMKNDEINSLNNKMKMVQKKSSIGIAEIKYQMQQQKNKITDLQKVIQKMKQSHEIRVKSYEQSEQKMRQEIEKLKQSINEVQKVQRQSERSHKAQLYQQQLKWSEQHSKRQNLKKQLESILRIFNPKQIMQQLNISSYDQMIPYLKMVEKCRGYQEEIAHMNKEVELIKSESLRTMEDTFSRLNSYEEVMATLKEKNSELEENIIKTQRTLEETHNELQQKESMLEQVGVFASEKYNQMNEQIQTLRTSVRNYERESLIDRDTKQKQEEDLAFVLQLRAQFEREEEAYLQRINELENYTQKLEAQKQQIQKQFQDHLTSYKETIFECQNAVERAEKNVRDKEDIISMMNNSLKELEMHSEATKQELEKCKLEVSELLRRKHKLQEDLREAQEFYQSKEGSLLEEIQMLRNYRKSSNREEEIPEVTPSSLEDELEPQPNWLQMYENCLQRHNKFIREVHYLLRKNQRKHSSSIEDSKILLMV